MTLTKSNEGDVVGILKVLSSEVQEDIPLQIPTVTGIVEERSPKTCSSVRHLRNTGFSLRDHFSTK